MHRVARRSQGFVYAAARMAVTGAASDDGRGRARGGGGSRQRATFRCTSASAIDYAGPGRTSRGFSDGVIVGSALVHSVLEGRRRRGRDLHRTFRNALDLRALPEKLRLWIETTRAESLKCLR